MHSGSSQPHLLQLSYLVTRAYQFQASLRPVGLLNLEAVSPIWSARSFILVTKMSTSRQTDFSFQYWTKSIDYAFQSSFILLGKRLFFSQQSRSSPKVQASTVAASFPDGSIIPQSRSQIVTHLPQMRLAEVPMEEAAFLVTLTLTFSDKSSTKVEPESLNRLITNQKGDYFGKRGYLSLLLHPLSLDDLGRSQMVKSPGLCRYYVFVLSDARQIDLVAGRADRKLVFFPPVLGFAFGRHLVKH